MTSKSNASTGRLRDDAPQIRTYEELTRKFEQLFDAIEQGRLDRPTEINGLLGSLRSIKALGLDIPMKWTLMMLKYAPAGTIVKEPRNELFKSFIRMPLPSADKEKIDGSEK